MRHVILRLLSILLTFVIGVSFHAALRRAKQHKLLTSIEQSAERGTIKWHVQRAMSKGERKVVLHPPLSCYATFNNPKRAIAEAASFCSVMVAQVLGKRSSVWEDDREVVTWYKFRIIENLNNKSLPEGTLPKRVPSELLPLKADEFLLVRTGGTVEVDGVKVVGISGGVPDFSVSQQYLLFLQPATYNYPDPTGQTGTLPYGLRSIFTVGSDGDIEPVSQEWHPLKDEIKSRHDHSLERLRTSLKNL